MEWFFLMALSGMVAALIIYTIRRRNGQKDFDVTGDIPVGSRFYPEVEKCHEINSKSITCSCLDFRKDREQFRHDDPRRLCKHLVKSFADGNSIPEELAFFWEGIQLSAENHNGFPSNKRRFDGVFSWGRISLMVPLETTEENPWIDVYTDAGRYRYSPGLRRWAEGTVPPLEREIIRFLYETLGRPAPKPTPRHMGTLSSDPVEKEKSQGVISRGMSKELDVIDRLLRTILTPGTTVEYRETRSYVAVTINAPRKWICRLSLRSGTLKRIEFPDGTRGDLQFSDDIMKYRRHFLAAYQMRVSGSMNAAPLFPVREHTSTPIRNTPTQSRDEAQFFSQN